MRTLIAVVIALLTGLVAGMGVISYRADSELAALRAERDQAQAAAARLQAEIDSRNRRVEALEAQNAAQNGQLNALERQSTRNAAADTGPSARGDVPLPGEAPPPLPFLPDTPAAEDGDSERDERNPWRDPERREEMRENFRQGVNEFLTDRIAQSRDATEQQRLAALAEYADYMFDLRGQIRDAETPEAREALEQEYENASSEARRVADDQQRGMIVRMAESYGISSPQQQEAFVQSVKEFMDDPLLRSTRFMTGSRGGWGRAGDGPGRGMGPGTGMGPGMGPPMPF